MASETTNDINAVLGQPDTSKGSIETNEISSDDGEEAKKMGHAGEKRSAESAELDDDKKAERRAANRRSAFQSRQRRKLLIEDLQRTVAALSKDNGDLRRSNDEFRVRLEAALIENHQLRVQQQLNMGNPAANLFGVQALQHAQAQALMRGGNQAALSQLLAASGAQQLQSGVPTSAPIVPATTASTVEKSEANTVPVEDSKSVVSNENKTERSSEKPADSGIQGILNAATATNNSSSSQADGIQGLLSQLQNQGHAGRDQISEALRSMLQKN